MSPPPDILRKKALYAAASVVMAFGLGCTEKDDDDEGSTDTGDTTAVGDDGGGDDGGGDDGAGAGDDGTGADGSGTGGGDGSGSGGDDGSGTGGEDGTSTGGDDGTSTGGDETAPDCTEASDLATCCEELAEWCNEAHGADTDAAVECIYGSDFDGSTGCIPWGPPVPPAMS
jgi:hypothetical protein